jgi:CheY-like chemotaxis protein
LAEIKDSNGLRDITTIVFTSSALQSDKKKSLALGAQQFITKPATFDGFIEAVKSACSRLKR